ncbi:TonB family protein [Leisingera sp. McT4-56]|uniref:TonB family protein n=1 Tax=Leisingera sp. McT4-56 TaxID=2881255 RepID=UPI001CF90A0C|nr:TonB family protein [Leisingera sp. McT4-56]MCB4456837.1 TonB C-terminal domain-containing protein [Leisingera sp. McT4-56]
MKRAAEFTVFAGLAGLIHIALFAGAPETGAQSSGAGGDALVSLQPASAEVARMAEAWQTSPETPQIDAPTADGAPSTLVPALPQIDLAQVPRAALLAPLTEPKAAQPVQADTAPPPPKPRRPESQPEPQAKPAPRPQPQQPRPPKANSNRNAAGQAGQQAAGAGSGAEAGQAGGAQTATADNGREAKLRNLWGNKIRARIERRKRYPSGARGQARVVLRLTVARDGRLLEHRIAKSSGSTVFDQAALAAVARAGRFPAAPKQLAASRIRLSLPVSFTR